MSGYDLRRNLGISLESLWAASYGQIYPTLHKLAAEGLISIREEARDEARGGRERIVYQITPAGRQEFRTWLEQPVSYLPYRDPFRLWSSYVDVLPDDVVLAGVERHIRLQRRRREYLEQVIAAIEAGEHPMIRARAEKLDPVALERLKATRAMIFRELAAQAAFEVESAERILEFWRELGPRAEPQ